MAHRSTVRRALGGSALAALLLTSACWHRHKPASVPSSGAPEGEIALRVTNHNYLDVTVYVLHDGQRTRVGTVTGSSTQLFLLPMRLLGQGREIQLLGDPIGSPAFARTETLIVQPGQYID
jgi:hypothetical protein